MTQRESAVLGPVTSPFKGPKTENSVPFVSLTLLHQLPVKRSVHPKKTGNITLLTPHTVELDRTHFTKNHRLELKKKKKKKKNFSQQKKEKV